MGQRKHPRSRRQWRRKRPQKPTVLTTLLKWPETAPDWQVFYRSNGRFKVDKTQLGHDDPQWQYSTESPPAMTPVQKRMAAHESSSTMVHDALAGGGSRAEQFKAGMVQGVHYLELVEPIKELKREGRLVEALALCEAAIKGAEHSRDGREPAPWYTEQAAIIHRKLGRTDQEIAVLKRWLKFIAVKDRDQTHLGQRLAKITG